MKAHDAPYHPPALRAYARARRDASTGLRALRLLAALTTLGLAFAMAVVRSADGGAAYLEGVTARGLSLHLVLVALPFGYVLAGRPAGDEASFTLAALHGVDRRTFEVTSSFEALRAAGLRGAAVAGLLAAEMVVFSLPETHLATKRAWLALAFAASGAALSAGLALLGLASSRAAGRFGRLAFCSAWIVPLVLSGVVPGYPAWATLPGVYRALLEQLL